MCICSLWCGWDSMWGHKLWSELFSGVCTTLASCSEQLLPDKGQGGSWGGCVMSQLLLCLCHSVTLTCAFSLPAWCWEVQRTTAAVHLLLMKHRRRHFESWQWKYKTSGLPSWRQIWGRMKSGSYRYVLKVNVYAVWELGRWDHFWLCSKHVYDASKSRVGYILSWVISEDWY